MKFFFGGLSIYLAIAAFYRVVFNNELLSDSYYRLIISLVCLIILLVIVLIEKQKSAQHPK